MLHNKKKVCLVSSIEFLNAFCFGIHMKPIDIHSNAENLGIQNILTM